MGSLGGDGSLAARLPPGGPEKEEAGEPSWVLSPAAQWLGRQSRWREQLMGADETQLGPRAGVLGANWACLVGAWCGAETQLP